METDQDYLLLLEKQDVPSINFQKIRQSKKLFIDLNCNQDDYCEIISALNKQLCELQAKKVTLLLEGNKSIMPETYKEISSLLSYLKNAQHLQLEIGFENNFNSDSVGFVSQALSNFKSLSSFVLRVNANNQFGSKDLQKLLSSIEQNDILSQLEINIEEGNKIEKSGAEQIGKLLKKMDKLSSLKLYIGEKNGIEKEGVMEIGQAFQQLIKLTNLDIFIGANNKLSKEGAISLGIGLSKLQNLEQLNFKIGRENSISNEGLIEIGNGIKNMKNLQVFNLQIDDKNLEEYNGFEGLLLGLEKCVQLKTLNLVIGNFNFSNEYKGDQLGKSFQQLVNLVNLSFSIGSKNKFGQCGLVQLGQGIEKMQKLQKININICSQNNVDDKSLIQFSNSISTCLGINELKIKIGISNQITCNGSTKSFQELTKLKALHLMQIQFAKLFEVSYKQEKHHLDLKINEIVQQEELSFLINGVAQCEQLINLKLFFNRESDLNDEIIAYYRKAFESQQSLKQLKVVMKIPGLVQINKVLSLLKIYISLQSLNKIEFDCSDLIKINYETFPNNNQQIKLGILVHPFQQLGKAGCQQIAEILEQLKSKISLLSLFVYKDNQINQDCLQILSEKILQMPALTSIAFNLQDVNPQMQQATKRVTNLLQRYVIDKLKLLKVYLPLYMKLSEKYEFDKNNLSDLYKYLPVMKHIQNLDQNFGQLVNPIQFGGEQFVNMANFEQDFNEFEQEE